MMWKRRGSSALSLFKTPLSGLSGGTLTSSSSFQGSSNIADDRLRMATDRFFQFHKHLKQLEVRISLYFENMVSLYKSQTLVWQSLRDVSRNTPLQTVVDDGSYCLGTPDASSPTSNTNEFNKSTPSSYLSTMETQNIAQHLEIFRTEIVEYVSEWETTVSTRVASELKHNASLYRTYEKYQQKVNHLFAQKEQRKSTNTSFDEKLAWNESKLRHARREYRRNLIAVTLLTEEVTDRSWKELVPLLLRLMDIDIKQRQGGRTVQEALLDVREEMVQLARRYEMEFEALHKGRLRILREEDALDFVDPEELQDLESNTTVLTPGFMAKIRGATPPCSEKDSHSTDENKQTQENVAGKEGSFEVAPPTHPVTNGRDGNRAELEDEDDDSESEGGGLQYPRSIYLVSGDDGAIVDDETTLTGVPDLASC